MSPAVVPHEDDLAAMLRWLGDEGWKPLLYAETPLGRHRHVAEWVCYPQGQVRSWTSVRTADPVSAVRGLFLYAQAHPNDPLRPLLTPRQDEPAEPAAAGAIVTATPPPSWRPWWTGIAGRSIDA